MSELDEKNNKLHVKLVYYGPALSGKTTNLVQLHDIISPQLKGEMMVLDTKNDRTLFFDMLPLGITTVNGLLIKVKLYTVPGQVQHDSTRKAVLSRADGVVFVADSQRNQSLNNAESFESLAANAARVGIDFDNLPLVVQFNKRDLADIQSESEIAQRWSKTPWPVIYGCAVQGKGVAEAFAELLKAVYATLDERYDLHAGQQLRQHDFIDGIMGEQVRQRIMDNTVAGQ